MCAEGASGMEVRRIITRLFGVLKGKAPQEMRCARNLPANENIVERMPVTSQIEVDRRPVLVSNEAKEAVRKVNQMMANVAYKVQHTKVEVGENFVAETCDKPAYDITRKFADGTSVVATKREECGRGTTDILTFDFFDKEDTLTQRVRVCSRDYDFLNWKEGQLMKYDDRVDNVYFYDNNDTEVFAANPNLLQKVNTLLTSLFTKK